MRLSETSVGTDARARLLVCDDDEAYRALLRAVLTEESYAVMEARDGDEALTLARSLRPDAIVLDFVMPARSGLEVLEEIRRDPGLADTPIVLCTPTTLLSRADAASFGADRYLAKPFSRRQLTEAVEELLDREL